jgi:hypothetical protein
MWTKKSFEVSGCVVWGRVEVGYQLQMRSRINRTLAV